MAFAEYLQLAKKVVLAPTGSPGDAITVALESGTPYRHYIAWVHVAGGGTIDVDAQPLFAGENDGVLTNFAAAGAQKVFQVTQEEIRPATRLNIKDQLQIPTLLKSELEITNNGANPVTISIYMLAAAAPGGA